MKLYSQITREVDLSRGGAKTSALFDFDGTLIAGYSVATFLKRRILSGRMPPREAIEQLFAIGSYGLGQIDFEKLLVDTAQSLRGITDDSIRRFAEDVFKSELAADLYPESRALVNAHLEKGHTVVLVSSASQYQVEYAAAELGIEHVVCTRLEVEEGRLTGRIIPPAAYGPGKLEAAQQFAESAGLDLAKAYFYTDGVEDLPLLEAVGFPRPINPDSALRARADREGWPSRSFSSRGLPGPADIARTGFVYGSFLTSYVAALPAYFLNKSKREFVNVATSIFSAVGGAAAGLDIRVDGEENLWSHRPAVFLFNHQSATDALIMARLLHRDFSGVAKVEIKSDPLIGALMESVGTIFIDRHDHDRAIEGLERAIKRLHKGISCAIAPEGSRSLGYRLGPFKMGAFHIAMQAGVPVVPIVIFNSSDALPKTGTFIRPAKVDVKVLPPVDTKHWSPASVHEHAESVRQMYLDELGQAADAAPPLRRVK
jgi:putative phosphoserine phosphatase/1-acylglycerol-3-phosphate O-acyltransferase